MFNVSFIDLGTLTLHCSSLRIVTAFNSYNLVNDSCEVLLDKQYTSS